MIFRWRFITDVLIFSIFEITLTENWVLHSITFTF